MMLWLFCSCEQAEKVEDGGWNEPPGFHLVPLPFADDLRAAPIEEASRGMFFAFFFLCGRRLKRCSCVYSR
jgi:hypothetical protein